MSCLLRNNVIINEKFILQEKYLYLFQSWLNIKNKIKMAAILDCTLFYQKIIKIVLLII